MPTRIDHVVGAVVGRLSQNAPPVFTEMTALWERLVSGEQAEHSEPYALRDKILFVRVDDSTRAFDLSRRFKQSLIRQICETLGEETLKDIVFRVGTVNKHSHSPKNHCKL